VVGRSYFEKII